jgi:cobalt/nickel transport system permease protein
MHIADGFLPVGVCVAGYGTAALLTGYALRKINRLDNPQQHIPRASMMAAAFFVVSWIHIPVPPTSVHLILNGLLGVVLGYYAVPAILVGLFFQAVMFQHGGLTTLGVNATMMGLPALLCYHLFHFHRFAGSNNRVAIGFFGFLAGGMGIGIATLIFWTLLITTLPTTIQADMEKAALMTMVVAHIPLMILEGIVTAMVVLFLSRVKPEIIEMSTAVA